MSTRSANNLFIRPLFYDALSGEFRPPLDPLGRAHTLGRLAYATFLKGVENPEDSEATEMRYRPTWAPGVEALVVCGVDIDSKQISLTSLTLEANKREDTFMDAPLPVHNDTRGLLIIDNEGNEDWYPLALGEELNGARRIVADAAQDFFNLAAEL